MSKIKTASLLVLALIVGIIVVMKLSSFQNTGAFSSEQSFDNVDIEKSSVGKPTSLRDSIVTFGTTLLGTPYVPAGCSVDGFDCSGFVYFVYQNFKIKVPRSSADFEYFGTEVSLEEAQKGDLLLFLSPTRNVIGHMGIVSKAAGKNSDFIHATSGKEMKVVTTNLANSGYTKRFVKAIRVLE